MLSFFLMPKLIFNQEDNYIAQVGLCASDLFLILSPTNKFLQDNLTSLSNNYKISKARADLQSRACTAYCLMKCDNNCNITHCHCVQNGLSLL